VLLVESRRRTIRSAGVGPALVGHREILVAVGRHDPAAAEAAMRRHLDWAERDIRADARARILATSTAGADGS
jgi:DNA-binding GntR family transcriptional regulator